MATFYNPNSVVDGLVFAIDAANIKSYSGTGLTVNGLVGGIGGTLVNSVGFGTTNYGYFIFNGSNYINVGSALNTGDNFTVLAWVKPGSFNIRNAIVGNAYPYSSVNGWYFALANNYSGNTNTFFISIGADVSYRTAINGSLAPNQWNYIGGTVSNGGGNITLYANGIGVTGYQGGILTTSTIAYITQDMGIGRRVSTNTEYLNGNIAQVHIYNRVLSSSEILQNFNALRGRYGV